MYTGCYSDKHSEFHITTSSAKNVARVFMCFPNVCLCINDRFVFKNKKKKQRDDTMRYVHKSGHKLKGAEIWWSYGVLIKGVCVCVCVYCICLCVHVCFFNNGQVHSIKALTDMFRCWAVMLLCLVGMCASPCGDRRRQEAEQGEVICC